MIRMSHLKELRFVIPEYYNFRKMNILSYKEIEEENKKLKEENLKLKKEIDKLKKFKNVRENLEISEELEAVKKELQTTKAELDKARESLVKKEEENNKLKNQNEELQKASSKLKEELEIVKNNYNALKAKYEKLEKDLPILEKIPSGMSFNELKEIGEERINELIKQKLLEIGYSKDIKELKEKYSQERLCNLLGITLEFPLQEKGNFKEILSRLLTLKNEFEKLSLEIVEEPKWSKNAYNFSPGYKYYWALKVPEIDVPFLSFILQNLQVKSHSLADIHFEEFLKIIDLLYTFEQTLSEARLEEKYLSVITDEEKRIQARYMERLDEKIKEKWIEKIRIFNEIKKNILLNFCILLEKIILISEGKTEKAKAIEYIPFKKEIEPKSKMVGIVYKKEGNGTITLLY
jgi:hypothetical protein